MIGKRQAEALQRYLELVQRPVSCVTPAFSTLHGDVMQPYPRYSLTLGAGERVLVTAAERLLSVSIRQCVELREQSTARRAERWWVRGRAYMYELREAASRKEIIAFHWQPHAGQLESEPHAHTKQEPALLGNAHIPSACMTVHHFGRFLTAELGGAPNLARGKAHSTV